MGNISSKLEKGANILYKHIFKSGKGNSENQTCKT